MKIILALISTMLLFGCSAKTNEKTKDGLLTVEDFDPNGGADATGFAGDRNDSRYYVNLDFFNMKSDDQLTIIENFQTIQQTTEWSCGPATAFMVLNNLGIKDYNEYQLAELMNSHVDSTTPGATPGTAAQFYDYGTNVKGMVDGFNAIPGVKVIETSYIENPKASDLTTKEDGLSDSKLGNIKPTFSSMSLYTSDNDDSSVNFVDAKDSYFVKWILSHLEKNEPIMVEWSDWSGHWQAIIGYDNNGTPQIGDDILIFADPYDTTDHFQDGYYYYPLERWFYMWSDTNIAAKPYQLQPYVIIAAK